MNTTRQPLVSCYMSVKNGLPYLVSAIESLRAQTHSRWEAVVVDDGSTDGTGDYLAHLSREDSRFKFIPTEGVGRAKALNMAFRNASGDYLANLDADDAAHPSRFEIQVAFMEALDLHFLASAATLLMNGAEPSWQALQRSEINVRDVSKSLMSYNPIYHSSVMLRRSAKTASSLYDCARTTQIDYELWARLAAEGHRIYMLDAPLAAKRIHRGQSYEHNAKLRYAYRSFQLQNQIIARLGGGRRHRAIALARLMYHLLPHGLRAGLKSKLNQ